MIDCLIVGGDSAIGKRLMRAVENRGLSVVETSRRTQLAEGKVHLDLETLTGLSELPPARHVALLAAETRFAVCAAEPERTHAINVTAPLEIAAHAVAAWDARVLFFSSIAVHDGSIDCPPESLRPTPNSLYGQQKLAAEDGLLVDGKNIAALRPSKVVDGDFPLFAGWRDALARGEVIEPFSDMLVSPVWIDDVVDVATRLMFDTVETGIFQYSAENQLSYAEIAAYIAQARGYEADLIRPVQAAERLDPRTLWLPKSARLDCLRLSAATGDVPPRAQDVIDRFLGTRPRGGSA